MNLERPSASLFAPEDLVAQPPARKSGAQKHRERTLRSLPHPEFWLTAPPELRGETRIILNCETTGLKWWAEDRPIGWAYVLPESGRSGYLPVRHETGENLPVEQVRAWLGDLRDLHIENTNTRFDLHMARADGADLVDDTGNTFGDAAHYAALLDDNRKRLNLDLLALDFLGWNVLGDTIGKIPPQIQHEGEFKHLHPGLVAPYALRNVIQVDQLIEHFAPLIEDEELGNVLALEQAIIPVVVEIEKNGSFLDMDLLEKWHAEVQVKLEEKQHFIYKQSGVDMTSPDSSKDLVALFTKLKIPFTTFTEKGAPSFTASVMKAIPHPCVQAAYEWGQLATLDANYLSKYLRTARADGWIRHNLHQLRFGKDENEKNGTISGRFSAAGDKNLKPNRDGSGGYNPQQCVAVEKQLERGWCPDYVLRKLFKINFASDMMQVEYRLFSHYANIADAFHAPPTQKIINGKPVWVTGPMADFHAVVSELLLPFNPRLNRKLVKNINFAKIYGAGLVKFALMIGAITEAQYDAFRERQSRRDWSVKDDPALAEAKAINNLYDRMFPAVAPLLKRASGMARDRGYVHTLLKRRARFGAANNRHHSALNRIVQGGAADINKRCLVEVYAQRKRLGLRMEITMHDELAGNLADPVGTLKEVDNVLNTQYFDLRAPILWDSKIGGNWAECK